MNDFTPIQKKIVAALEQMKEKSLMTEAALQRKSAKMQRFRERIRPVFVSKIWKSALNIWQKKI